MNAPYRKKGTVLITVLLMVAVAAIIASEIAYRQQMDILRTGAFLSRDTATLYLMAAEELGLFALHQDREQDDKDRRSNNVEISDHLGEDWNKPGAYPLPGGIGTVEGRLIDLQSRFNVNALLSSHGQQAYFNAFEGILNKVIQAHPEAFDEGVTASMLRERVVDWLDSDQTSSGFDGMEDDDYFRKSVPYRTANHFITEASELLLIEGFTPRALAYLENQLSFLPPSAKINLYTADKDLLLDLGFGAVEVNEFTEKQRPRQHKQKFAVSYNGVDDVFTYLRGNNTAAAPPSEEGEQDADPESPTTPQTQRRSGLSNEMFDIKSNFFLLKGKAVVNDRPVLVESVIWKPDLESAGNDDENGGLADTSRKTLPVTTIFRKFVDPLKQTN